jgi:hypothetical protein
MGSLRILLALAASVSLATPLRAGDGPDELMPGRRIERRGLLRQHAGAQACSGGPGAAAQCDLPGVLVPNAICYAASTGCITVTSTTVP